MARGYCQNTTKKRNTHRGDPMRGSMCTRARHLWLALAGSIVLTLAACGGDGAKPGGEPPPASSSKAVIEVQADRSNASVSKPVGFSVAAVTDGTKID